MSGVEDHCTTSNRQQKIRLKPPISNQHQHQLRSISPVDAHFFVRKTNILDDSLIGAPWLWFWGSVHSPFVVRLGSRYKSLPIILRRKNKRVAATFRKQFIKICWDCWGMWPNDQKGQASFVGHAMAQFTLVAVCWYQERWYWTQTSPIVPSGMTHPPGNIGSFDAAKPPGCQVIMLQRELLQALLTFKVQTFVGILEQTWHFRKGR